MKRTIVFAIAVCCLLAVALSISGQKLVRSPQSALGFEPGQERHLANWDQIFSYFKTLADASPRVQLRELGRSTLGRPLILAIISSEANLKKLDRLREVQRLLADPRLIASDEAAERLVSEGKIIVAISCSLHSTEIVASQMSMELAYRLANDNSSETREILDNALILLLPSINPDGIDIVASWYEKTLGTPFEGTDPPELYHHYAGHDNNRDWFMLTQVETQLVTRMFYGEWFPQIVYDVHQMGANGARMFVPPFADPPNPNIDPLLLREVGRIGSHMAVALTQAGFKGILSNAQFDTWWHGGFRTAPYYHNAVGILSEAASARLMSPTDVRSEQLQGQGPGVPNLHTRSTSFPDPWPGGLWQPKDILDMELVAARSLLLLAARYKNEFMLNCYRTGRRAIEAGRTQPPFAYVIPSEQHDPVAAARLINILIEQGIEVHQARRSFVVNGVRYPAGTFVILMAQPYRACAKALLEPQNYPAITGPGDAESHQPYDIAGWTLPMQMGVRAIDVERQFDADLRKIDSAAPPEVGIEGSADGQPSRMWIIRPQTNNAYALVNELITSDAPMRVSRLNEDVEIDKKVYERGSFVLTPEGPRRESAGDLIHELALKYYEKIQSVGRVPTEKISPLRPTRIGLYRSWVPSTDEGWTRWVLEQYGFQFQALRDAEIRAGSLIEQFDEIILPDQPAPQILEGHGSGKYPQQYTGGVGPMGVQQLKAFVDAGGILVCLGRAGEMVLEHFDLPIRNALAQVSRREFFCPGSVVAIEVDNLHPLAYGMPSKSLAFFQNSLAFEVQATPEATTVDVVARYAGSEVLKSGYLLGEDRIAGRPAVIEAKLGRGRIILIGFPSQHRGQSHGTFKLLFNSVFEAEVSQNRQTKEG
jgi:hypothetical protein